ncbi:MAG TPA: hypothetical protein DCQ14_02840 [Firmicutes bacterium]|nr:hypothetical protein [Bacillota bacterium]
MVNENALDIIREYFKSREDVTAVYLFGSTVKNKERIGSDLDLALLFKEGLEPYHRFQTKLQLTNELEDLMKHKIDIVDLRSADPFFVHQVMKNKILVFDRHIFERVAFEVNCRKMFFDFMPIHEQYQRQARKRLRERRG